MHGEHLKTKKMLGGMSLDTRSGHVKNPNVIEPYIFLLWSWGKKLGMEQQYVSKSIQSEAPSHS